jgi:hypothetical protein
MTSYSLVTSCSLNSDSGMRAFRSQDAAYSVLPELPRLNSSLLARTDFRSDDPWRVVRDHVLRENEDGLRAYLEPVSDPAFDGVAWGGSQGGSTR